jgi:phosphohistidine phosphatase
VPQHRLVLVRHAEAANGPDDVNRPLTDRGAQHAAAIGAWLDKAGSVPDRVLVSPARRARQTWELAGARLLPGRQPMVDERIYDNTVEALLEAIRETPEDVRTLAVVGHNPSVGALAGVLDDGQGSPAARGEIGAGFRTGGVAVFVLETPFTAIGPDSATLSDFAVPGD